MDPNKDIPLAPCKRTSSWAFIGYLEDGTAVPIGVWSDYRVGRLASNTWMSSTPKAEKWEGTVLYETLLGEDDDEV